MSIGKLAKLAVADGMPALAITDTNNLFGALEFSEKLAKEGVQPIIGIELAIDFGDGIEVAPRGGDPGTGRTSIVLLAKDAAGYRNLMHLASCAWLDPAPGDLPHVPLAKLEAHGEGLIALSGGPKGPLDRAFASGLREVAGRRLEALARTFPDRFYIELQRHGLAREREIEPELVDLAFRRGLPLVATNEAYFAEAEDYEAHDALLCIADGTVIGD
ncbi:MAG: PHP domain-containing protein, partial [Methylovirgula sp.]